MTTSTFIRIAGGLGALAVILGAFGAHALAPHLDELQLRNFRTASMYHFVHVIVLLVLGFSHSYKKNSVVTQSFVLLTSGIMLFSGSLYILSTRHLIGGDFWLFMGPVTPLGGVLLVIGWLNLLRFK
jgi:uncharacterized membrane protein YgdD (TMEM256/DUF423 family)